MAVTVGLLGPLVVERDGTPVDAGTLRQRALLALLALNAGHALSLDAVIDALWDEEAPGRPEASVRAYVANLRRALEPGRPARAPAMLLVTSGSGYRLDLPEESVDALRFARLAREAVRAEHDGNGQGALAAATGALACWRGAALVDVQGAPFAVAVATRLEADRDRQAFVHLRALVELGRPAEARPPLEARVAGDPMDEAATALLMQALYALGHPAEALARYGALRDALDERGLLPSPPVQDLEGAILRHDVAVASPPARAHRPVVAPLTAPSAVVGRADAWSRLAAAMARPEPRASWIVLRGEPGIGKTYLAEALAEAVPGPCLFGRAQQGEGQPPLWLWTPVLAAKRIGPAGGVAPVAAELVDGLRAAATGGRVLVLLDDVQWADADSLRVLRLVAADTRRLAVTFVLTLRPGRGRPVDVALLDVLRQPDAAVLELTPFGTAEAASMAENLGTPLDDPAAAALVEASGGNPLLVRELLRLPADRRAGPLPREVAAVVAARLEPLPAATTRLLILAALAGDDVDVDLLAAAAGTDPGAVLAGLDPAVGAAILQGEPLRFRHTSLREAVLSEVPAAATREGHLRLAEAADGDRDRWPAARTLHHRAAARPLGAVGDLVAAARRAGGRCGPGVRLPLALEAGEACVRAGNDIDAQRHLAAALDLAAARGDQDAAAQAVRTLTRGGGAWYWVPFGQHPVDLLGRLERAAAHSADDTTRSLFLAALAVGESYGPDPGRPARLAGEALALARRGEDPEALAEALVAVSWAGFGTAPPATLLGLVDELDRLAPTMAPERRALAQAFRLAATLRQGDLAAAATALGAGETLARAHRLPAFEATFAWARATVLATGGGLAAADTAAERAHELHQRTQVYAAELARHLVALHLADQRGELATAGEHADGLARLDDHGDLYQARVASARDTPLDGEQLAARLGAVLDEAPAWHRVSRLAVVGHLVAAQGLTGLIAETEAALEPFAAELISPGTALVCGGPVAAVAARLALADGRPGDAVDRLRAALAAAEANGLRGWLAPLHADLAWSLHAAGDETAAERSATTAVEVARRTGQPGVAARAARWRRPLRLVGDNSYPFPTASAVSAAP
jgi:DNA-binding SARP family transcriptional activator